MARIAIVVLVPIVALLAWRDYVMERQIRLLAVYDAAHHEWRGEQQIAARDERIDDAMWKLLLREPAAALEAIDDVSRMPAPTPVPQRAWRLASAASCALGEPRAELSDWLAGDARVRRFCTLENPGQNAARAAYKGHGAHGDPADASGGGAPGMARLRGRAAPERAGL